MLDADDEEEMYDEDEDDWTPKPSKSHIKQEWDHLLEDNDIDVGGLESGPPRTSRKSRLGKAVMITA